MKTMLFCFFAGAPVWTSLGFLAGASFSYMTKREIFSAWDSLALQSKTLLTRCEAGAQEFKERDLAALRDAIRLLEDLGALPGDATASSAENA